MPEPLTIAGARNALASGALSPVDLLEDCLSRTEASEPRIRAWITLDAGGARREAGRLAGRGSEGVPLWGIPVGIKDIVDVAGLPTTAGSKILAGNVARADAPVVRALRAAGAVVVGKTNTQEFAYGCVTPPTTNPWDPARIPGGSSGGSAAAVSAGHCLGGLGTDTAGSIRIPAALCGVCGLKPRPGIVPVDGVIPLARSFDAVGPIARTVEDLGILWQAMTSGPPAERGRPDIALGVPPVEALPELSPGVAGTFARALETLARLGARVKEVPCPALERFDACRVPIVMWEALDVHRSMGWWPDRAAEYTDETRGYHERAERSLTAQDVADARSACRVLSARLMEAVDRFGILVTPSVPCEAPTHEEAAAIEEGGARRPVVMRLTRIPGAVNAAGLAALSIPCGLTEAGLPAGLQLIGRDEDLLLAAGRGIEREAGWAPLVP